MLKCIKNSLLYTFALILCSNLAVAQLQSERFFNNTGGLVDRYSTLVSPPNSASDMANISLDDRGQLSKRLGYQKDNEVSLGTSSVQGMGYLPTASAGRFVVAVGTALYATSSSFGGSYTSVTGTASITSSQTNLIQFTRFAGNLIGCSDHDVPFKIGATGSAASLVIGSTKTKTCAGFNGYLVIGNTTESGINYPSRVRWSDVQNPDSFPVLNYIDVDPDDGDGIVSLAAYQNSLYIFKKRSIHQLIITGLDGANAFTVRPVARGIGASAKLSVQTIDQIGLVFLASNGVYLYDGNGVELISDPIQRSIDAISRSQYAYATSGIYKTRNQYWLAVSTTGSTNNTVLVYDYIQGAWTRYTGINAQAMAAAEDSNGTPQILTGSVSGNVHIHDTGLVDYPDGTATGINAYYVTHDLSFGAPDLDKNFKYLYVYTIIDSTTTVVVETANDFNSVYTSSYTFVLEKVGALWGTAIWGTDLWPSSEGRIFRVELHQNSKLLRLRFSNSAIGQLIGILGWSIVYDLEDYKE